MKKILIFLILVISVPVYSQSTFRYGVKIGENGTTIDSLTIDSDSLYIYSNGVKYTSAWDLEQTVGDGIAPTFSSATTIGQDTVHITFSEALANYTPVTDSFTVTQDASGIDISSVVLNGANLYLLLSDTISTGTTLLTSYSKPYINGLRDAANNWVDSYTDSSVTNDYGVPTTPSDISYVYYDSIATDFNGSSDGDSIGYNIVPAFLGDWEVFVVATADDGMRGNPQYFFGTRYTTSAFGFRIDVDGKLTLKAYYGGVNGVNELFTTTNAIFDNGVNSKKIINLRSVSDSLILYVDNVAQSFVSADYSNWDGMPDRSMWQALEYRDDVGTKSSYFDGTIHYLWIDDAVLSDSDRTDIYNYFNEN